MKLATLVTFLRPAAAMLVLLFLIGWAEQAAGKPASRSRSQPLQNKDTLQTVIEVSNQVSLFNLTQLNLSQLSEQILNLQVYRKNVILHKSQLNSDYFLKNCLLQVKFCIENHLHNKSLKVKMFSCRRKDFTVLNI